MDTYFSIDAIDAARTGLPLFKAESGVRDVSVSPVVFIRLTKAWYLGIGFKYSHLLEDAEDSPVVDIRGDANQWIAGAGIAYIWGW